MPLDTSWMQAALNQPQAPSFDEMQQSRNKLALQNMQLQKAQMEMQDYAREREGLQQLRAQLQGADPEHMFEISAQHFLSIGDAEKAAKAMEALNKIRRAKQAEALFSQATGGAGAPSAPPPGAAAMDGNALAPGSAPSAPANAMAPGAAPERDRVRQLGMQLMAMGDPRGEQIISRLNEMFPQDTRAPIAVTKEGQTVYVSPSQAIGMAPAMAPGEQARLGMEAQRLKLAEAQDARERAAAERDANKVAQTITDEAGNVRMFNAMGQEITPSAAPGAAPIKGKPSATFEKTQAARAQQARDLDMTLAQLKEISAPGGLIDQSTGSGFGRGIDIAAGAVGQAMPGAIAIGKLQPIADMVLKQVPRFEGPQSDKDTQSYKEAAGQLANPSLPREIRTGAAKTIIRLMETRKGQFVSADMAAQGVAPGGIKFLGYEK